MAQLLSYAPTLHPSLGTAGWHRKYVVLPALFICFGGIELPIRMLTRGHDVINGERGTGVVEGVAWWYVSYGLQLRAVYVLLFLTTFCMWIVLSVRVVTKTGKLSAAACDPHDRYLLRLARWMLMFALIFTIAGITAPQSRLWYTIGASM